MQRIKHSSTISDYLKKLLVSSSKVYGNNGILKFSFFFVSGLWQKEGMYELFLSYTLLQNIFLFYFSLLQSKFDLCCFIIIYVWSRGLNIRLVVGRPGCKAKRLRGKLVFRLCTAPCLTFSIKE